MINYMALKLKISDYSTLMFDLPKDITSDINKLIDEKLDKNDLISNDKLPDYAQAENGIIRDSHITVLFGIRDKTSINAKPLVENYGPISVTLGKTNYFENDFLDYDVVYLEVLSSDLRKLRKVLVDNLDHADSGFSFVPHISMIYVRKGEGKKYKGLNDFEGKKIEFNKIKFSSFNGKDNTLIDL